MIESYIAVDIGASSGRLIAGFIENSVLKTEEIHRFKNGYVQKEGHFVWDTEHLFAQILKGLKAASAKGYEPISLGIDTWGVDYVLIDKRGEPTAPAYAYRDGRTSREVLEKLWSQISARELYKRNGIQKQAFNTIYQLFEQKLRDPDALERAETLLMMPDYLNFKLTGIRKSEYTNGTTSQLVSCAARDWDYDLIAKLGLPAKIFSHLNPPGTTVGPLKAEIADRLGLKHGLEVVMVASHDTASAVAAAPLLSDDHIFLSSGTWSLMGVERLEPDCSELSYEHNFTNEGGCNYRYRYLKNIMGLWILQNLRREIFCPSFEAYYAAAVRGSSFQGVVDVNDSSFLAPPSMKDAITGYCRSHSLPVPQNDDEILCCAYNSLASSYEKTVREIELITGRTYECINIIGGGCQDKLLNYLIARRTGKRIYTGPVEGTAIGNLCVQMLKAGKIQDLDSARRLITRSFAITLVDDDDSAFTFKA